MEKNIYCENKIIGEITYQKYDRGSSKVIRIVQKNYLPLKTFFSVEISQIKIHLLYSRSEMNKYWGAKTPTWMCGFTKDKNKIYVLSPLICQEVSEHSEENIYKVVAHELIHLFIKKINKNPFGWLNEGLALFLAKQMKGKSIKKEDWEFLIKHGFIINPKLKWTKVANRSGYRASYLLVNFLIKNYGKSKLIRLLDIKANKRDAFQRLKQVLEISLDGFIKNFQKSLKFL